MVFHPASLKALIMAWPTAAAAGNSASREIRSGAVSCRQRCCPTPSRAHVLSTDVLHFRPPRAPTVHAAAPCVRAWSCGARRERRPRSTPQRTAPVTRAEVQRCIEWRRAQSIAHSLVRRLHLLPACAGGAWRRGEWTRAWRTIGRGVGSEQRQRAMTDGRWHREMR